MQLRCPVRLRFYPNGSRLISVEVHGPSPLPACCHNTPDINELGRPVRRLIALVHAVRALDAAVVLRAVSTLSNARKAGRCCRNDSPSSRSGRQTTWKDRDSVGNRDAQDCGPNCRQIDNLRKYVRPVLLP